MLNVLSALILTAGVKANAAKPLVEYEYGDAVNIPEMNLTGVVVGWWNSTPLSSRAPTDERRRARRALTVYVRENGTGEIVHVPGQQEAAVAIQKGYTLLVIGSPKDGYIFPSLDKEVVGRSSEMLYVQCVDQGSDGLTIQLTNQKQYRIRPEHIDAVVFRATPRRFFFSGFNGAFVKASRLNDISILTIEWLEQTIIPQIMAREPSLWHLPSEQEVLRRWMERMTRVPTESGFAWRKPGAEVTPPNFKNLPVSVIPTGVPSHSIAVMDDGAVLLVEDLGEGPLLLEVLVGAGFDLFQLMIAGDVLSLGFKNVSPKQVKLSGLIHLTAPWINWGREVNVHFNKDGTVNSCTRLFRVMVWDASMPIYK